MREFAEYLIAHPVMWGLVVVCAFMGMRWSLGNLRAMKEAEWFVEHGQHNIVTNDVLDDMRASANLNGVGHAFEDEMEGLRKLHGRMITVGQALLAYERSLKTVGKSYFK